MGRRARSNSNASAQIQQTNSRNVHLNQLRALTDNSPRPAVVAMSPSSRYNHNLKVLRRRDPSIVSIFDQFSHVCLYHHNGEKWEKKGYEGSMFLYERNAYPPYGFYILNRMGMDDYIQRMYPEDDMNILGDYLMYKCYPDYTGLRLGLPMDNHRGIDPDLKNDKHKGRSITVGLWMFATESREPMKDVMMRLHDYIGRDQPYPQDFRYGPDHPPPPNPHLRITNDSSPEHSDATSASRPDSSHPPHQSSNRAKPELDELFPSNGKMSEIDKLFAKFVPGQPPLSIPQPSVTMSVDSLFAAALNSSESSPSPGPRASSSVSNRGLALLDSIFASATPEIQAPSPSVPILSPKPTSSTLPQILNQNVISTLLGLSPSPAGSVSSSGYRYEGDSESTSEEGGFSEGDFSTSATILNEDAEPQVRQPPAKPVPSFSFSNLAGLTEQNMSSPVVQGDVTPRPAHKGMRSSTPPPPELSPNRRREQQHHLLQPISRREAVPEVQAHSLVPFEPDSELWPYPRAPLDDRSLDTDGEVVELDFNNISALSDPNTFQAKPNGKAGGGKKKKDKKKEKEEIEKSWDDPVTGNGPSAGVLSAQPRQTPVKGKARAEPTNGVTPVKKVATQSGQVVNGVDRLAAKDSMLAAAAPALKRAGVDPARRNDFVREILTLIHTDKGFVDDMWEEYLARTNN